MPCRVSSLTEVQVALCATNMLTAPSIQVCQYQCQQYKRSAPYNSVSELTRLADRPIDGAAALITSGVEYVQEATVQARVISGRFRSDWLGTGHNKI